MNRHLLLTISLLCIFICTITTSALSTTFVWDGPATGIWTSGSTWRNGDTGNTGDGIPGEQDTAGFVSTTVDLVGASSQPVSRIEVFASDVTLRTAGTQQLLTGQGLPAGLEWLTIASDSETNSNSRLRVTDGLGTIRSTLTVASGAGAGPIGIGVRGGRGRSSLEVDGNAQVSASRFQVGSLGRPASLSAINGGDIVGLNGGSLRVDGPNSMVDVNGTGSSLSGFSNVTISAPDSQFSVSNNGQVVIGDFNLFGFESFAVVRSNGLFSTANLNIGLDARFLLQGGTLRFTRYTGPSRPVLEALDWTTGTLDIRNQFGARLGQTAGGTNLGSGLVLDKGKMLRVDNGLSIDRDGLLSLQGGTLQGLLTINGGTLVSIVPINLGSLQFNTNMFGTVVGDVRGANTNDQFNVPSGRELSVVGGFDYDGTARILTDSRLSIITTNGQVADLGISTSLGPGSRLTTNNGARLTAGESLNSNSDVLIDGDFINNGTVNGPSSFTTRRIAFNDNVSGAGNYTGNIEFLQEFSPGNSPGTVSFENILLADSSTLSIELGGLLSGEFDHLLVSGEATISGLLEVLLLDDFTPSLGSTFEIINIEGNRSGQFLGLSEGSLIAATNNTFKISYLGGDGNDVVLTVVPEPTSLVLFGLFGLPLLMRQHLHS